jgi:hypothetical protein
LLQAVDNKVFSSAIYGKLKKSTNPTEKPKRMGVLMTLRPKNFFLTLALIIAGQAVYAEEPAVHAEETEADRAARLFRAGASRTSNADLAIEELDTRLPRSNPDDAAKPLSAQEIEANAPTSFIKTAGAAAKAGAGVGDFSYTRCPFVAESLSPEFLRLVTDGMCLPNTTQRDYCACLERYSRGNTYFEDASKSQAHHLRRVGYQHLLQQWSDRFALQVEAFNAYGQPQNFPRSCDPSAVYQNLKNEMSNASGCPAASDEASRGDFDLAMEVMLGLKNENSSSMVVLFFHQLLVDR